MSINYLPVLQLEDYEEDRPMPSRNHARVAQRIAYYLEARYGESLEIMPQLSLRLNGWASIPDLSVYRKGNLSSDWNSDEEEVEQAPLLVVEVLSPHQTLGPLMDKIQRYLREGVLSAWLVQPMTRTVILSSREGAHRAFSEGVVKDDLIGVEMPLEKVFG